LKDDGSVIMEQSMKFGEGVGSRCQRKIVGCYQDGQGVTCVRFFVSEGVNDFSVNVEAVNER